MTLKPIHSLPGYFASDSGEIFSSARSCPGELKKLTPRDRSGYKRVSAVPKGMKQRQYAVHRLIAEAFLGNPDGKPQVNHINGIKSDNRPENLEWATAQENSQHAVTVLGKTNRALSSSSVIEIRNRRASGESLRSLAKTFHLSAVGILKICRKQSYANI